MSISLKIVSYHRLSPGQQEVFTSDSVAFTIGRNEENDWAIPDPQRFLSGVHCRVHVESGNYYLTDTSTNGVFLNGAEKRLERNVTVAINDQDKFRIGDFEFEVLIDDSASSNVIADEEDYDETPFDDNATFIGQAASEDEFDDEFDDPFSDPAPSHSGSTRNDNDDFEKDINTPLEHLDKTPMAANAVSIESLLDLDDLDENEDEQVSAESLRVRHNPLNDSFKASNRVESKTKPEQSIEFDDNFSTDIPDNWDEATGMLKVAKAPASHIQNDPFDTDGDDNEFESASNGASDANDISTDMPDDWEDALEIFDNPVEPSSAAENEHVENEQVESKSVDSTPAPVEPAKTEPVAAPAAVEKTPQPAAPPATAAPATPPPATATPARPSHAGGALAAFIAGAGLKSEDLAGVDESALFEQVGSVLAEFTDGLVQTLSGRTHIKSEFRLDQTMIRPVENNPLKFSTSKISTLKQLLSQQDTAYMTGAKAVKEGFDDVNAHQMAVVAGMEAALQDILKRFNPEALEKRLESDSFLDNILPGGKKAKYWEMFKLLFDQIAGEAEDDFQQLFGSKFSRAYEQQLDRLKNNH